MFDRATARIALLAALSCVAITATPHVAAATAPIAALACANAHLPLSILDGAAAHSEGAALKMVVVRAPKATLHLAVAANEYNREIGLMCVVRMRAHAGMIFEFGKDVQQQFWMKNTLIPLDMIWVESSGVVNTVAANVPASSMQTTDDAVARRNGFGRYVIELRPGEALRDGIAPGVKLTIPAL
jgi:uncharacterized membrane protein (UPF0127 family)